MIMEKLILALKLSKKIPEKINGWISQFDLWKWCSHEVDMANDLRANDERYWTGYVYAL